MTDPVLRPGSGRRPPMTEEARKAGRRWGMAIVGGLGLVVAVNFYVWWLVHDQAPNLVTEAYYEEGLRYGEVVAAGDTLRQQDLRLAVTAAGNLELRNPAGAVAVTGATVAYYRPNDPSADYVTPARAENGALVPVTSPPLPGRWNVTLRGWAGGTRVAATARWYRSN